MNSASTVIAGISGSLGCGGIASLRADPEVIGYAQLPLEKKVAIPATLAKQNGLIERAFS